MSCPHSPGDDCPLCSETLAPGGLSATSRRGAEVQDVEFLPQGTKVGRYVLLSHLGQGGMGVVYSAHDPQLQRIVAIKLLRPQAGDGESAGQSRLLREAQAMAQLSHPNVVQVFDCGTFRDGVFIAMEFVRGQSLDQWMGTGVRPWREVLQLFLAAGRGLAAAHASDILHRDFKPPNVLLGEDGRPRVSDFGLARSRKRGTLQPSDRVLKAAVPGPLSMELTQAGSLMGSPSYMSPEQHAGEVTAAATDQYSFCVSLYEALYGRRPFEANTLAELAALKQRPPVLQPEGTEVPAWVHRAVVRGLAPLPADRFPEMGELLRALEVDPSYSARRRRLLGAGAVAVVGGLAVVGAYLGTARAHSCVGVEGRVQEDWSPEVQQRVEAAFLGTGAPYATEALGRVREGMATWAAGWGAARREACEAANVRGEQTQRQQLLRVACLERQREEFGAVAGVLATANASVVANAADAVQRLPVLADCADVRWLEDRRALPEALRARASELEAALARARGVATAGDLPSARAQLRAVVDEAGKVGLGGLQAETQAALGDLEVRAFNFDSAHAAYGEAVRAGLLAGDDRLAARVLARLVSVVGWRLHQPRQALLLGNLAEALLERTGQEAGLRALLAEGRGDAEWAAGAQESSLSHYREALQWVEASAGRESLDAARLRGSVAWLQMERGEVLEAREGFQQALMTRERLLGTSNPALADAWCDLSNVEGELLDLEEAVVSARRCATLRDTAGTGVQGRAMPRLIWSSHLQVAGKTAEAASVFSEALTLVAGHEDEDGVVRAHADEVRLRLLVAQGEAAQAAGMAGAALQRWEALYGTQHAELMDLLGAIAAAQRDAGDSRAARATFDRYFALSKAEGARPSPATAAVLLERSALLLGTPGEAAALEDAGDALTALEAGGPCTGARLAARRRWAEALWRVPALRAEARRVLESALPHMDAQGRADSEAWLAAHRGPGGPG